MRWDRVYASGRNDGESVAATNACGGTLGTTAEGYASAGPRRQLRTGPGPVRAATGNRPTQAYSFGYVAHLLCYTSRATADNSCPPNMWHSL